MRLGGRAWVTTGNGTPQRASRCQGPYPDFPFEAWTRAHVDRNSWVNPCTFVSGEEALKKNGIGPSYFTKEEGMEIRGYGG